MKEIKFRVFESVSKTMIYDGGVPLDGSRVAQELSNDIIMQFTGLRDRNRKDVFEGDIIICRDGKFVIEYCENFAAFIMTNKDLIRKPEHLCEQDANFCMRSIEVIGNIYEDKKLMGAKN